MEKVRQYEASNGVEYFISYETVDSSILVGYIRLRLNNAMDNTMPELRGCAFVRELHVLGNHLNVGSIADDNTSQHRGFGKRLIATAEAIAKENRFKKIAIISGVGVRDYYRKQGYYLENSFMMKVLDKELDISFGNNKNSLFSPARMILADIVIAIAGDILQSFVEF